MNYRFVRKITIAFYLLFALFFAGGLIRWGSSELGRLKHYSEADLKYVSLVLNSQQVMSKVDEAHSLVLLHRTDDMATALQDRTAVLNRVVNRLVEFEQGKISNSEALGRSLVDDVLLLRSASASLKDALASSDLDHDLLFRESGEAIGRAARGIRYQIERKTAEELNLSKKRHAEVSFFYQRLLKLLILFFVLTVSFSVSSSFMLGRILRKGLDRLSLGAHEISSGNMEYSFDDIPGDEVGSVMRDFNYMARQLQKKTADLQQANVRLINANKHKDRFLANMSHELRTPLNSVVGFSELLIERGGTMNPERISKYGQRIMNAAEHLLELISDLLDVAKIDAGVAQLEPVEFDLSQCCGELAGLLQPVVENNGLDFSVSIDDDIMLTADRRMIRQMVINLVNNAAKFTHEGEVSLRVIEENAHCVITVSDTGIGISEEDQERIFDDFNRVESGMTANYEGVGIGLTLTKRFVELHRGTISLHSSLDKGSDFTIRLPKERIKDET